MRRGITGNWQFPDRLLEHSSILIREIRGFTARCTHVSAIAIGRSGSPAASADPYLLNGALIEGIATTIMQRIPAERREEVSRQAMRVLHDRLRAKEPSDGAPRLHPRVT